LFAFNIEQFYNNQRNVSSSNNSEDKFSFVQPKIQLQERRHLNLAASSGFASLRLITLFPMMTDKNIVIIDCPSPLPANDPKRASCNIKEVQCIVKILNKINTDVLEGKIGAPSKDDIRVITPYKGGLLTIKE
jgi:hypothetical protein